MHCPLFNNKISSFQLPNSNVTMELCNMMITVLPSFDGFSNGCIANFLTPNPPFLISSMHEMRLLKATSLSSVKYQLIPLCPSWILHILLTFCLLTALPRLLFLLYYYFLVPQQSCPSWLLRPLLTSSGPTTVMSIVVTPLLIISCLSNLTVVNWRQLLACSTFII